jgi:hypothetical protein
MTSLIGQESIWNECISKFDTACHIFITGAAGCGKTTLMKEILKEYARVKKRPNKHIWGEESHDECLILGPEQDRGIQTIRGQVSLFIRQMCVGESIFRWVIIDDVDTFPQISQQALRRPMESYSHITRFLFIGTSEEDLIPALRSRCIHIPMNTVDPYTHKDIFLKNLKFPSPEKFTEDMWSWVINISGTNISDLIRLLKLIRDICVTFNHDPTLHKVQILCSAPFYLDFIPLLNAIIIKDNIASIKAILAIWKRGYAYEDILESFQIINNMYGTSVLQNNVLIHKFLINAWISYCKGNTSILSLQNVLYKTLEEKV